MARAFTIASSASIIAGSAPVTAAPLTLACWFKADDLTNNHTLVGLFKLNPGSGSESFFLSASGATAGDPLQALTATSGDIYVSASSSIGYSSGVWQHACGVYPAANSRIIYLDGGNSGSEGSSVTPSGIDRTYMGAFHYIGGTIYSNCSVAEVGIWNIALSADDAASLAKGFSPLMVRPASLVAYYPLVGRYSPEIELKAGNNGTVSAATQADHPRVIYPSPPQTALFTDPGLTSIGLFDPLLRKEAWFDESVA